MVASCAPPAGDLAGNPGRCPDWELDQRSFGSQAGAPPTELHQPGPYFLKTATLLMAQQFTNADGLTTRGDNWSVTSFLRGVARDFVRVGNCFSRLLTWPGSTGICVRERRVGFPGWASLPHMPNPNRGRSKG